MDEAEQRRLRALQAAVNRRLASVDQNQNNSDAKKNKRLPETTTDSDSDNDDDNSADEAKQQDKPDRDEQLQELIACPICLEPMKYAVSTW
jgi:hypothetical protein